MTGPLKVVVTGASGFLGGALARRLAAEGHKVRAVARRPPLVVGRQESPQGQWSDDRSRLKVSDQATRVTWQAADVTQPATLAGLFDGADWVIHAAGMLGQFGVSEATYRQVNAEGVWYVLAEFERARAAGRLGPVARLLHVGSAGVLGPMRGRAEGFAFDETMPLAPSNPYERSKALAESYAREFILAGLPGIIARPEFVYGPGDRHVLGLFSAIQRGVFFTVGDGRNHCHPTYVDDVVDGLLACLRQGQPGQVYQIAGPRPVTFRELAETIAAELGVSSPRLRLPKALATLGAAGLEVIGNVTGRSVPLSRTSVAFFSEDRRFNIAKAERELGYTPHFDLPEGIRRTVEWYREEGLL
jgi:nucleoside-diphosphate-sugar epimerase